MRPPAWDSATKKATLAFAIALGAIFLRLVDGWVTQLLGVP